jgi:hypothetical protein
MPTGRDIQIDAALSAFALAYKPSGSIADIICPRVPVQKDSDYYYIFGSENMKTYRTIRAPKSGPNLIKGTISSTTYVAKAHSLGEWIDDKDRAAAPFNLRENTVQDLIDAMTLDWEVEVKTAFTTTGNYASSSFYTTLTGSDQFNSGTGPDIEKLIDDAAKVIRDGCGSVPNTLVIPWEVALVMKRMSQIQEQRKNVTDLTQVAGLPPQLWGYKVLVAGAQYDSAKDGQTKSFASVWSDSMILMYLDPNTTWKSMAFAKNFSVGNGLYVASEMLPKHVAPFNAEQIEVYDDGRVAKVVGSSCAYLWQDCLA